MTETHTINFLKNEVNEKNNEKKDYIKIIE